MTPARIVRGARGLVLAGVITVAAPAAAQAPGAPVDAGEGDTGDAEAGDARDDNLAPYQVITAIAEP